MSHFFNFYKNSNGIIKLIFFGVVLLLGGLWIVGSLTKLDRLVMFVSGTILGGVLINIFLYDYVVLAINYVSKIFA